MVGGEGTAPAAPGSGAVGPPQRVPTRKLGSSDMEVPIATMGTMTMGEQNSEEESFAILDYCMSRGVNHFDTAELYPVPPRQDTNGDTERLLGRWMAARGNRDQVLITTKVAGVMPGLDRSFVTANRHDPPLKDAPQPQLCAAQIREACEASLRKMQTSYIDLYLIHWPARYAPTFGKRRYCPEQERPHVGFEEQVQAMGALIKEGKVREWGLSNETAYGVCRFCEAAARLGVKPPVAIQNDVSLVLRSFEGDLAECCAPSNYNVGLCAYGVLAGGTLTGKYLGGAKPSKARHTLFPGFQPRYLTPRVAAAAADYAALARRAGLTPAQLAQAWAATRWYMATVIIGGTTVEQVAENVDACCMDLGEGVEAELDELFLRHGNANLVD